MQKSITIFKALDHLFCEPDKKEYSEIRKDGRLIGYNLDNIIRVCNQHDYVTATPHPNPDVNYIMLVFGKYPVRTFLLQPIGRLVITREHYNYDITI